MERKIQTLEDRLNFMVGRLDAVQYLVAAFIGVSPDADDFAKKVLPQLAKSHESVHRKNHDPQTRMAGFSAAVEACSGVIEDAQRRLASASGVPSQRT